MSKILLTKLQRVEKEEVENDPFNYCIIFSNPGDSNLQRAFLDPEKNFIEETNLETIENNSNLAYFKYVSKVDKEKLFDTFVVQIKDNVVLDSRSIDGTKTLESVLSCNKSMIKNK